MAKRILRSLIVFILIFAFACQTETEQPAPKKIESKTGVEGSDATSQEVDTLNKKMDELMQGVQ